MKVLYELDLNDIIRIVAEKYGVPQEKVKKSNKDGLNYLMIDMSETETPAPNYKPTVHIDEKLNNYKAPEQPLDNIPTEEVSDEVFQELKYKQITDEKLRLAIKNGLKIADICKEYCLTAKKYAQRLYARIAKFNEGFKEILDEKSRILIRRLKKAQEKHEENGITIYTCPVCEKKFNTEKYPDYAYKKQMFNQKHIFCGYDCMRKAEKLNP